MPVDTPMTNGMERTPYVTETLRVRCPGCRKLYLVQYHDIQEAKPRFECVQCHGRFWLSLPDMDLTSELTGIPLQVKEAPAAPMRARKPQSGSGAAAKTEPCPKCFKPNTLSASECSSCGVLLSKARASELAFTEPGVPPHSPQLEAAWKKVIADFNDESLHIEFMKMAERERALPYAAAQYGQMQKLMPTDEVTKRKIAEIQALADTLMPPRAGGLFATGSAQAGLANGQAAGKERFAKKPYARVWQLPLLGAAILIIAGMWIPFFRNLVGVGAAFLFLAVAMQMQFGRRS
jgi:hypothetical protein